MKRYRQFISIEDDEIAGVLEGKKRPSVLAPKNFMNWVRGRYYELKSDGEIPDNKTLCPDADRIINTVCAFYSVKRNDLYKSRRGEFNEPRNAAIWLMRKMRRDSLKIIAREFQMEKYSSVSSIIQRLNLKMQSNRNLKDRINNLIDQINKSHGQT